jgi:predicted permease
MSLIDGARYRLRVLLRGRSHARNLNDEVAHHLELSAIEAKSDAGGAMSDDEAHSRARREFGNTTYSNEERRTIAGLTVFDAVGQDVRFILRLLRRRAAFAAVTVATIALGIGSATSIFTVADAVLFRALPFPHADRLIAVWLERPAWKAIPGLAKRWDRGTFSLPLFRTWRAAQTSFDDVAVWTTGPAIAGDPAAADEVTVGSASASLLPVLGIHVERGSWFTESDEAIGAAPVAVVSHETWAARFGSDPGIVGRVVLLDGVPHTIVGIMPRGFDLDRSGTIVAYWTAAGRDSGGATGRTSFTFQAIGRLKPNVSLAAATAESGRSFRAAEEDDDDRVKGAALATLHVDQTRIVRRPLLILLAAASLLLLIACINVATLLMGEAASREQELRTRSALGASRTRLLRQLLTESVLLAGVGASAGAALAYFATKVIVRSAPPTIPGLGDVRVDLRVLGVALTVAVATGLLFGLAPALSLTRSSHGASAAKFSARGRGRAQRSLVACEVALSIVLLVGAGLLVRSFDKLSSIGFRSSNLLVVGMRLRASPYTDSAHTRALYAEITRRLRLLPGVDAAAVTTLPPFFTGSSSGSFEVEGRPQSHDSQQPEAQRRVTSPDFFATAGVPIIAGRAYSDDDRGDRPLVIVVSRALAQREWPDESAIAKRIKVNGAWRTIVGVAGDIETERPSTDPPETFYAPLEQLMLRAAPALLVRTRSDVADAAGEIRRVVQGVEAGVAVSRVDRMDDLVAASLADDRLRTELIALFGAIAALLAAVGTYGVAATSAARRTREMAIRVAVGASSGSIARLIVGSAAKGVVLGAAAGLVLSQLGVRILSPYIYGVRITDPIVYVSVGILLAITTLAATWIPARRATRVRLVDTLAADS